LVVYSLSALAAARKPAPEPPQPLPRGLVTPDYAPGRVPFHQGEQLVYRVSWIGIPAADARIVLGSGDKGAATWKGEAWISTNKFVDVFFRMRDYAREDFSRSSLASHDVYMDQHENKRHSEYRINFDRAAGVVTAVRHTSRGDDIHRFKADNPWGPFSGALMALSQPLKIGDKFIFDVFGGRNRYVIGFNVAKRETIDTDLGEIDAFRIVPSMIYVSDSDARKKARQTTVWVSADKRHLPLRIEAAAFIGTLRVDLTQVSDASPPTQVSSQTR
jgi:hypothetical protein